MLSTLKQLFQLLNKQQQQQLLILQGLIILMSLFELVSVASIGPFMAIVAKPELIDEHPAFQQLYTFFNCQNSYELLVILGASVLCLLSLSSILSLATTWKLTKFGESTGAELGSRLFNYFMAQNWLFHTSNNSASLITKINTEVGRTTTVIIQPALSICSKSVLVLFLAAGIFCLNPLVAIIGLSVVALFYRLIYKLIRERLINNGEEISKYSKLKFQSLSEGFGGIKDTLILNKQHFFEDQFLNNSNTLAASQSINSILAVAPRYLMEVVTFGSIISLVIFLIISENGNLAEVLPIIAIYALAGFKLMPALQNIFQSIAYIKANVSAFEQIKNELQASNIPKIKLDRQPAPLKNSIELNDLKFTYPSTATPALKNITLSIKANSTIAFVGASGSGKSTLIDILIGLITPDEGQLRIDNTTINDSNRIYWQQNIGYVPQSIFLSDSSIAENIAFGDSREHIDFDRLTTAIKLAHLDTFISELAEGIETRVGERGVQLSGGQRQRIGIARALYHDPEVLIFDEATSALDGITEKQIMNAIEEFSGKKTIIMIAHRLTTVEKCDMIYLMDKGTIIDKGDYNYLYEKNTIFRNMASFNNIQ
ncbi:MAG: ABC transporter ATP-binding protein [Pseudomonadales bacterium]|nr:ABC transporter ATP-binding protein [Pseudomonadales bacterium]